MDILLINSSFFLGDMMTFNSMSEQEVVNLLNRSFDATDMPQEKEDLKRLLELKDHPELAKSDDDFRIVQILKTMTFLNMCAIENDTEIDLAHDPISKNIKLYEQYQMARISTI